MKLAKRELVQLLHTEGDNATAKQVEAAGFSDEIDTERDADALAAVGLDRDRLMAKLASGGIPRIVG